MSDGTPTGAPEAATPLARVPADILTTLSPAQQAMLAKLLAPGRLYPLSLRFTLPFTRFFVAIIGGRDRRSPARRRLEAHRHPLVTVGNALFVLALTALFSTLAAVMLLIYSRVLEL